MTALPGPAGDAVAYPVLDDGQRARLRPYGTTRRIRAGEILYSPASESNDLLVVLSGEVVVSNDALRPSVELARHGPGHFAGELNMVTGQRPFLTARAATDGWVLALTPAQVRDAWLGTGGNPGSTIRAGQAGLPISYGILSGTPPRWGQHCELYRKAARQAGADESKLAISVAGHDFIGRDGRAAKDLFFRHEQAAYAAFGRFPARSWPEAAANYSPGGMVFAGDPEEIAERIIDLHHHLGHRRHFLQMDIGGMPHAEVLKSFELLGTEVAPRVRAELADKP